MNLINLFYKNEYFIRIVPYYFTGYDEKGGIMNMQENDTICLLKECDAGSKMAVSAIDEIIEKVHCPDFKDLLNDCTPKEKEILYQSALQLKTVLKR